MEYSTLRLFTERRSGDAVQAAGYSPNVDTNDRGSSWLLRPAIEHSREKHVIRWSGWGWRRGSDRERCWCAWRWRRYRWHWRRTGRLWDRQRVAKRADLAASPPSPLLLLGFQC